jgi:hypothetical protein
MSTINTAKQLSTFFDWKGSCDWIQVVSAGGCLGRSIRSVHSAAQCYRPLSAFGRSVPSAQIGSAFFPLLSFLTWRYARGEGLALLAPSDFCCPCLCSSGLSYMLSWDPNPHLLLSHKNSKGAYQSRHLLLVSSLVCVLCTIRPWLLLHNNSS